MNDSLAPEFNARGQSKEEDRNGICAAFIAMGFLFVNNKLSCKNKRHFHSFPLILPIIAGTVFWIYLFLDKEALLSEKVIVSVA